MTKEEFKKHIEDKHGRDNCSICKKYLRTKRAHQNRKNKEAILRSMGLKKVRGSLGGIYWE
jgi:hypothetical protein